jgi:hypothetical protein
MVVLFIVKLKHRVFTTMLSGSVGGQSGGARLSRAAAGNGFQHTLRLTAALAWY